MTPNQAIESRIFLIRGHRVMFGADLALIYGITTKRLNQQVRRNLDRFPADFGFQLNFIRLRELLGNHEDLARRLNDLEARYDGQFKVVFDAIRQLMASAPEPAERRIGFHPDA